MKTIKIVFALLLIALPLMSSGQTTKDRTVLGKSYASEALKETLDSTKQHNVVDGKTILVKDSLTAIAIAEPILFGIYGKENIVKQRPYEIYFIDSYWIITGTLPKNHLGGTFILIMDSRNSSILKISHGK